MHRKEKKVNKQPKLFLKKNKQKKKQITKQTNKQEDKCYNFTGGKTRTKVWTFFIHIVKRIKVSFISKSVSNET